MGSRRGVRRVERVEPRKGISTLVIEVRTVLPLSSLTSLPRTRLLTVSYLVSADNSIL